MAMKAGTCTYVTCVYMWLTTLHLARLHVHQGQVHVRDMYILLCISHLAVPLLRYSGPDITIPTNFVARPPRPIGGPGGPWGWVGSSFLVGFFITS